MKIADKLDASPKVVNDWRNFWSWWSVRFNLANFLVALGYTGGLVAGFWSLRSVFPPLVFAILVASISIASMVSRLRNQKPDDDDDNDEHA